MNRQTIYTMLAGGAALFLASMLFRTNGRTRAMRALRRSYYTSRSFLNVLGKQMMRRFQTAR
ncbi:hypothetical protein [Hazenella coriacea]|uniref:Uncharacterized protein n=1 Tax=Hazenella coriacea TaxID=1179467 RepID=A0A4V2UV95_9BACL|nr:hypothetical protein [Hazenella coriacea]TCS94897.1 hypothetical protein EDD58_103321 [Hazenella coriacea]